MLYVLCSMNRNYCLNLLFMLFVSFCSSFVIAQSEKDSAFQKNYEQRIHLSKINDVYIPINTEDAMKELDRLTEKEARKKLTSVPEDTIASKLHFSLGRWMLLNWGIEEGSRLSHYYKQKGVSYPDDQIDLLLRCFYRHVADAPLREDDLIHYYREKRQAEFQERKKKAKVIKELGPSKKHNE